MLKYNNIIRIANSLAEKDVEFNCKLNKNITEKEKQKLYTSRFNYYNKIMNEERVTIEDEIDESLEILIED